MLEVGVDFYFIWVSYLISCKDSDIVWLVNYEKHLIVYGQDKGQCRNDMICR